MAANISEHLTAKTLMLQTSAKGTPLAFYLSFLRRSNTSITEGGVAKWTSVTICIFALVSLMLLVQGIYMHFPNVDEVGHLPSGISHWKFGKFDMYRVNPPLVRLVAGLPAWYSEPNYDWSLYSTTVGQRPEFQIGPSFLAKMRLGLHNYYILPRAFCLIFFLLGLFVLSVWSYKSLGASAAIVVSAYWCFCPNILAHAQTIVPDVGAASTGLLASFAGWCYTMNPSRTGSIFCGLAIGLALLSKLTWLTLAVSLPLALLACGSFSAKDFRRRKLSQRFVDFCLMCFLALLTLNCGYLFCGSFKYLNDYQFCSHLLGGSLASPDNPDNAFKRSLLGLLPVPLPKDYVLGFDYLRFEVEEKKWSFLDGQWKYGGWKRYYLFTTLWKTPEPLLVSSFIGVALCYGLFVRRVMTRPAFGYFAFLAIPAVVAFASISLQDGFSHHHRYVLFIYPSFFAFAAVGVSKFVKSRSIRLITSIACVGFVGNTFWIGPDFLSYTNLLGGGHANCWRKLGYSNVEWGQDLMALAERMRRSPPDGDVYLDLEFFTCRGELFGLNKCEPPMRCRKDEVTSIPPGTYIVSTRRLFNLPNEPGLEYLQQFAPVDRVFNSYFIYKIGVSDLKRPPAFLPDAAQPGKNDLVK